MSENEGMKGSDIDEDYIISSFSQAMSVSNDDCRHP
jgi:hypothetical protein